MPQQREHPTQARDSYPQSPLLPLKWKRGVLARRFATKRTLTPLPTSQRESGAAENTPTQGEHSCVASMCVHDVFCKSGLKTPDHTTLTGTNHAGVKIHFSPCRWWDCNLSFLRCHCKYRQFRLSEGADLT